jgi:ATP-dependent helicase/nuclease subunit A
MSYLDTNKSIMISSPAGSGKTEKLARRYIALLQSGVDVERILAITFTDKAAAEMKQRILRILRDRDDKLFCHLLERMPLMRVSTIHSFCGTLLRRFSFDAGIDPNYGIADEMDAGMQWEEILYEVLMERQQTAVSRQRSGNETDFILQTLSEKGFRGLDYLKGTMDYLFQKRPFSLEAEPFLHVPSAADELTEELLSWEGAADAIDNYKKIFVKGSRREIISIEDHFLTSAGMPRQKTPAALKGLAGYKEWALKMSLYWKDVRLEEFSERSGRIWAIFNACLRKYIIRKKAKGVLDFSDLEYFAYRMLTENPEWANILYAFDERTDHILVDEFQDTNNFQWAVINKLTEEWRSGMGAKRAGGTRPTIFFVGDEKQSIYFFRGANVEIFHRAKEQMETWLGDEFLYEEAKENYRSRPALVDFTNLIFSKVMGRPGDWPWITRYSPFTAQRPGLPHSGRIEVVLLEPEEDAKMEARKQKEAEVIAQRIKSLAGTFEIQDRGSEQTRFCGYSDIAILLKKRTHLAPYEEALRKYDIPFVAVKGIGFYQEMEIAMLRSLVFFLSNPHDDYSLYMLLKSPLFNIAESSILQLTGSEGESLFEKMENCTHENPPASPFAKGGANSPLSRGVVCASPPLEKGGKGGFEETVALLRDWLAQSAHTPLAELIEHALVSTKAWRYFHEKQKWANIKKFIRIMEGLEADGRSLIKIRDFLERTIDEQEAKANVNTEGMDAVKIMTIHAAKGLEFPVVIVPGIEEPFSAKTGDNLIYERDSRFFFKSVTEASIRDGDEDFLIHKAKETEEQIRLFYVAVTRAEEALILTGHWESRENSFLGFLTEGLGLQRQGTSYTSGADMMGLSLLTEEDVKMLYEHAPGREPAQTLPPRIAVIPLPDRARVPWKTVTETADIRRRHGKDWLILGDIMHRIFEGVSEGLLSEQDIGARAEKLLGSKGVSREQAAEQTMIIEKDIETLKGKGIWQGIIMPREDAFAELPFVLDAGDAVYSGRIDRIIKEDNVYKIYDYKTFPVKDNEVGYLLKEYSFQMGIYRQAVRRLFNTNAVKSFIVFTHTGDVREIP